MHGANAMRRRSDQLVDCVDVLGLLEMALTDFWFFFCWMLKQQARAVVCEMPASQQPAGERPNREAEQRYVAGPKVRWAIGLGLLY
jgi:hypothetical protein